MKLKKPTPLEFIPADDHAKDSNDALILRACLGTLRDDEPLPPWVDWSKIPKIIMFVAIMSSGKTKGFIFFPEKEILSNLNGYWHNRGQGTMLHKGVHIPIASLIYLPHPSLWRRSLQERPRK